MSVGLQLVGVVGTVVVVLAVHVGAHWDVAAHGAAKQNRRVKGSEEWLVALVCLLSSTWGRPAPGRGRQVSSPLSQLFSTGSALATVEGSIVPA